MARACDNVLDLIPMPNEWALANSNQRFMIPVRKVGPTDNPYHVHQKWLYVTRTVGSIPES